MIGIKKLREKAGLTQVQVATSLEVGQSTVALWENEAEAFPRGQLLPKIAELFDCSIDDLFREEQGRTG